MPRNDPSTEMTLAKRESPSLENILTGLDDGLGLGNAEGLGDADTDGVGEGEGLVVGDELGDE